MSVDGVCVEASTDHPQGTHMMSSEQAVGTAYRQTGIYRRVALDGEGGDRASGVVRDAGRSVSSPPFDASRPDGVTGLTL